MKNDNKKKWKFTNLRFQRWTKKIRQQNKFQSSWIKYHPIDPMTMMMMMCFFSFHYHFNWIKLRNYFLLQMINLYTHTINWLTRFNFVFFFWIIQQYQCQNSFRFFFWIRLLSIRFVRHKPVEHLCMLATGGSFLFWIFFFTKYFIP